MRATLLFNSFGAGWIPGAVKAQPSLKTLIDGFTNHPYGLAHENSGGKWGPGAMEQMHGEAVADGVANTSFYVTEFGVEAGRTHQSRLQRVPRNWLREGLLVLPGT